MTDTASDSVVRIDVHERIMTVRLNRPEKKNALTREMYRLLADGLAAADPDDAVHVVVLRGTGDCFCSGNDLADFRAPRDPGEKSAGLRFLETLAAVEKPVIAAVSGPAVGIGTTMLLHCDLVFAGMSACFHLPFVNLGLCPEGASSFLLPRLIGYPRAAEMLLLGEPVTARLAWEYGLINNVYKDDELMDEVFRHAGRLAEQPLASVCLTKRMLKASRYRSIRETFAAEAVHFAERLESAEFREASDRFFQSRKS